MRVEALASVLSRKLKENEVKVIDSIAIDPPKTKIAASILRTVLGAASRHTTFNVLVVRDPARAEITRAIRNLENAKVVSPNAMSIEDALRFKIVLLDKNAITSMRQGANRS